VLSCGGESLPTHGLYDITPSATVSSGMFGVWEADEVSRTDHLPLREGVELTQTSRVELRQYSFRMTTRCTEPGGVSHAEVSANANNDETYVLA
jgi:hypothetical protein